VKEKYIPTAEEVTRFMSLLEPGREPEGVWLQGLRLHAVATFEAIPYRITDGKIQVYMIKRPATDPLFSNTFHTPGTMCSGSDNTLEDAFQRLKTDELSELKIDNPEQIEAFYRVSPRGNEAVFMHLVKVFEGGNPENWYDADNIPLNTTQVHVDMIKKCVKAINKKGQKRHNWAFE
jgi:hypothetical protein